MQYAAGKHALGICDRCGFQYKLLELKPVYVKKQKTGLLVCAECWEPSHPQLELGSQPIYDPLALRNPRPDTGLELSRVVYWGWRPLQGISANSALGDVTVTGDDV